MQLQQNEGNVLQELNQTTNERFIKTSRTTAGFVLLARCLFNSHFMHCNFGFGEGIGCLRKAKIQFPLLPRKRRNIDWITKQIPIGRDNQGRKTRRRCYALDSENSFATVMWEEEIAKSRRRKTHSINWNRTLSGGGEMARILSERKLVEKMSSVTASWALCCVCVPIVCERVAFCLPSLFATVYLGRQQDDDAVDEP